MTDPFILWFATGIISAVVIVAWALLKNTYGNLKEGMKDIKQDISLLFKKIDMLSANYVKHDDFKELEKRVRECERKIDMCKYCNNHD